MLREGPGSRHDHSVSNEDTAFTILRKLRHLKPIHELREKFSYNNLMYIAATAVVQKYAGMPYPEFVTQRIFKPLNMTTTTYFSAHVRKLGLLSQSFGEGSRRIPYWFDGREDLIAGAGGVLSSAEDMVCHDIPCVIV
jgi:CubicO group peptidase (beta-lactamase class C family)